MIEILPSLAGSEVAGFRGFFELTMIAIRRRSLSPLPSFLLVIRVDI